MPTFTVSSLPDALYQRIEDRARVRGKAVGDVAAEMLTRALADDDAREEELLTAIRAERDEMARQGVYVTEDDINEAKRRGRP